jgi:hypothetical protein
MRDAAAEDDPRSLPDRALQGAETPIAALALDR